MNTAGSTLTPCTRSRGYSTRLFRHLSQPVILISILGCLGPQKAQAQAQLLAPLIEGLIEGTAARAAAGTAARGLAARGLAAEAGVAERWAAQQGGRFVYRPRYNNRSYQISPSFQFNLPETQAPTEYYGEQPEVAPNYRSYDQGPSVYAGQEAPVNEQSYNEQAASDQNDNQVSGIDNSYYATTTEYPNEECVCQVPTPPCPE